MDNIRDGKVVEGIFDAYDLSVKERVVAGHLLAYIDVGDCTIEELKEDVFSVMNRYVSFYQRIYEKDSDIVNKLLQAEYLSIMETYCEEDKKDSLNLIISCIEEVLDKT